MTFGIIKKLKKHWSFRSCLVTFIIIGTKIVRFRGKGSNTNGTVCPPNVDSEKYSDRCRRWCSLGNVFFVHFRDIKGQGKRFQETFHDNGPTDMARMLQVYYESGFDGPIRPDHAPTLEGESEESRGNGMVGKVFAIGYMKGLMESMDIPYH